jgi:hypothetical protein
LHLRQTFQFIHSLHRAPLQLMRLLFFKLSHYRRVMWGGRELSPNDAATNGAIEFLIDRRDILFQEIDVTHNIDAQAWRGFC